VVDEHQFVESLQKISKSIDQEELKSVFQAWMKWVQEASENNGGYVRL
jgi:ferritin-like metal-binding protein YciE